MNASIHGFQPRNPIVTRDIQLRSDSMRKLLVAVITACIGLAVSATPANAGLFSAKGEIIAILAGDLFLGEAEGHLSGDGTVAIRSQKDPDLTCQGQFTSSAERGGFGQLVCSDGATATFQFKRLSVFRGYGSGKFSRGEMSFAYGLSADEAAPYVKLPPGKRLAYYGKELKLADL
jgi:hypothetical protein